VSLDHLRHLVQVGDELAAASDDVAAVHRILAESMLTLPADWAAVWALGPPDCLQFADVRHTDPGRSVGLRARLASAAAAVGGPGRDGAGRGRSGADRNGSDRGSGGKDGKDSRGGEGGSGGSLEQVLSSGRTLRSTQRFLRDLQIPPELSALVQEYQVTSAVLVPVWGRRGPVGVVMAARSGTAVLCGADADFALALARRAGTILETARLIEEVSYQAAVVDSVSDAVIAVDRDHLVTIWNAAAERMYGIPAGSAFGHKLAELVVDEPDDPDELRLDYPSGCGDILQRAVRQGAWRGRVRQTSSVGRKVEVETSLAVRRNGRGEYDGLVAVNRDLTEVLAARAAAVAQETFTRDLMDALDSRAAVLDGSGYVVSANARWRVGLAERDRCVCGPVPEGTDWLGIVRASHLSMSRTSSPGGAGAARLPGAGPAGVPVPGRRTRARHRDRGRPPARRRGRCRRGAVRRQLAASAGG
jgi:PAS domain S-box-containing protein